MTKVTLHLFSSSEADFPYASRSIDPPADPFTVGDVLTLRDGVETYEPSATADVTAIRRSLDLGSLEVLITSDAGDDDLVKLAVLDGWTRHRKAKGPKPTDFRYDDDDE
jgi:hypothetical protein